MKNLILIILLLLVLNLPISSYAKIQNKIVLKVENQIITDYEIKNKILSSLILAGLEVNQENINKFKRKAVNSLITFKLMKIELDRVNIKSDNAKVNAYLNSISSNNILELKNKFNQNNLDFELFLQEIKVQLKWQEFIYKLYSNKIEIDTDNIDQELQTIIKNNSNIKEFRISEIEILNDKQELEKERILTIQNQIKSEGFEKTAVKYSISSSSNNKGDLGWINAESLSEKILNILNTMNIGETSKPIKRQNSIIFLKIADKRSSKTKDINLSELKSKLVNQKKNELYNLYSRSHLSKLKNNSLIEYK